MNLPFLYSNGKICYLIWGIIVPLTEFLKLGKQLLFFSYLFPAYSLTISEKMALAILWFVEELSAGFPPTFERA